MDVLLKISIVLIVGVIGGKLAKLAKLPNVSGYLVVGLFLGPSFFHIINATDTKSFTIISEVALALIAFSIGSEFVMKDMLKLGKAIAIITLTEVIGAIALVFVVMFYGFNQSFAFSIVIASMSAATAPAATLLVMKQYRSHGPLTKTVLPVVALDDVYGIIAFGIALSLAKLSINSTDVSLLKMISDPLIEIGGSLLLGFVLGFILSLISKKAENHDEIQVVTLAAIGAAVGLSNLLGFSPLLTNIVMGTTVVNLVHNSKRIFGAVNNFAPAVYVLFFTLAGASLELSILATVGGMGIAYIFARGIGKAIGASFGAVVMKSESTVKKYIGLCLLPQGGISIGLSVVVAKYLPADLATAITTIIMFSVLIYETTGPIFAKIAIYKAGEIGGLDKIQSTEPQINTTDPVIA